MAGYDVTIMTDLRFPGGSSSSTLEEIRVQHAMGLKTGLFHRFSPVLHKKRPFHKGITESILEKQCDLINFEDNIRTNLLVVRHPSVVHPRSNPLPSLYVENVVLVINHPPINSDGRVDYILPFVRTSLHKQYGCEPLLYPIGPLVRNAVEEIYQDSVTLQKNDWSNVFDCRKFEVVERSPTPGKPLRIGRHSRPGRSEVA